MWRKRPRLAIAIDIMRIRPQSLPVLGCDFFTLWKVAVIGLGHYCYVHEAKKARRRIILQLSGNIL